MTDPLYDGEDEANTPLEAEEREQLIPTYITTRAELNEAEQVNITRASLWLRRARAVALAQRDGPGPTRCCSYQSWPNARASHRGEFSSDGAPNRAHRTARG